MFFSYHFHLSINLISDYYTAATRGRPPSTSGTPSYEMQGKINLFPERIIFFFLFTAGGNHLMSPLQATSAAYNPMTGAAAPQYGHPYGSAHHQAPPMHGLPPSHVAAAAHMHAVHQQQLQQQNPHMMSVQNGPVILVSNLNEDVSLKKTFLVLLNDKIEKSFIYFYLLTNLSYYNFIF
jgi:hypothetical protein